MVTCCGNFATSFGSHTDLKALTLKADAPHMT